MFYRPDLTSFGLQWFLTPQCNYRCPYCFDKDKDLPHFPYRLADCKALLDRLGREKGTIQINFSGGEPSHHPFFFELLAYASRAGHVLFAVTNLSQPFAKFAAAVAEPGRCYLNASFHKAHVQILPFAAKVKQFQEAGFHISCSQVLYPPWLAEALANRAYFKTVLPEVYFGFNIFFGEYQGKTYPDSYTPEELGLLQAGEIDLTQRLERTKVPAHRLCRAGKDFAGIARNGHIIRCVSQIPLGEQVFPDLELLVEPEPCPLGQCLCPDMHEFWEP